MKTPCQKRRRHRTGARATTWTPHTSTPSTTTTTPRAIDRAMANKIPRAMRPTDRATRAPRLRAWRTMTRVAVFALALSLSSALLARADAGEETAVDHIIEVYDEDANGLIDASELSELFERFAARVGDGAGASAHAGHAGHAGHDDEEKLTKVTSAGVIAEYAGVDKMLNETELTQALTLVARCAAETGCALVASEATAAVTKQEKYYSLKVGLLFAIFAEGLVGGMIPMMVTMTLSKVQHALELMNSLSGGVFIASGFVHLIPHALEAATEAKIGTKDEYPFAMVMVVLGFLIAFFVERVVFHTHSHIVETETTRHGHGHVKDVEKVPEVDPLACDDCHHEHGTSIFIQTRKALVFMTGVALHATLAGVSLGLQTSKSSIYAIFIAISAHKAAAAFSIGCAFLRCGVTRVSTLLAFMTIFACITPIGIAIGIAAGTKDNASVRAVLEGIAAGTFVYIGTVEVIGDEFETTTESCTDNHGHDHKVPTHTHVVHEAPRRSLRMEKFLAYFIGVCIIVLSQLGVKHGH